MSPSTSQRLPIYAVDASSIIGLENDHQNGSILYTPPQQQRIWTELTRMSHAGQIKIIERVPDEVLMYSETGYNKLQTLVKTTSRKNRRIVIRYREIIGKYPDWEAEPGEPEPADPWIVAYSSIKGWQVISDEKRLQEQAHPILNAPKIPDACDLYKVQPHKLREFAEIQGWIS